MNRRELLETHLIETFVEVARRGSVTRAAESLNRSQPAISHRLRAIEERFDVPIFEKSGRQLKLTEYGQRLFDESVGVLDQLRDLRERVTGDVDEIRGSVTIGTFPTVARHMLLEAIEKLLNDYDELSLNFQFSPADRLLEALRGASVDMVVFVGDVDTSEFESLQLGMTKLVAVMAPSLAGSEGPDLTALRRLRYLSWSGPSDPTFDAANRYVARHEIRDRRTPEIPHIEALRALAKRGVGFAILPEYTTLRDVESGALVTNPLPQFEETIPVYMLRRQKQAGGSAIDCVRDTIIGSVSDLL